MKSVKIALAVVVVASGIVASFAFAKPEKKRTPTDHYYKSLTGYQRLQFGNTSASLPLVEKSPEADAGVTFKTLTSWTTVPQTYNVGSTNQEYIGKISFEEDAVNPPNGGGDGDLTLTEALTALYNYYTLNSQFPPSLQLTVGTTVITIEPADAAH